ncbi:hypothetical protein CIB48_g8343 [Xylaria polymorpha]|nr:hypothetical protein CIB48_g8343 [Xylaria polymorpha]
MDSTYRPRLMKDDLLMRFLDYIPLVHHFGSNLIEDAGAGFECTDALCRHTFHYVPINDAVDESLTRLQYIILQDELSWRGEQISQGALMRARCEIVQHAQALSWAIDPLALCSVPWTEDAVKTIHKILYNNMADEDVIPGEYRGPDHPIAAKHIDTTTGKATISRFIHPRAVSSYMAAWVEDLNEDIRRAESGPPFDPYDLAARNGRVSRIILNSLVMKFTGHLISISEDEEKKYEYLCIAVRSTKKYYEEDGEVSQEEQKGHRCGLGSPMGLEVDLGTEVIRGAHICIKQHLSASSPTQIQASAPHVRVSAATRSPPVPQLVPSDRVVSVVAPHMRPRRPGTGCARPFAGFRVLVQAALGTSVAAFVAFCSRYIRPNSIPDPSVRAMISSGDGRPLAGIGEIVA